MQRLLFTLNFYTTTRNEKCDFYPKDDDETVTVGTAAVSWRRGHSLKQKFVPSSGLFYR